MSTEIRTIRLCREPIGKTITEKPYFFATDYFDILIAEEKKLDDTFCSIMNLENDLSSEEKTSAQSYTLYFSEKMYQKYEMQEECAHKGSPFDAEKDLNFLSIIQVHITPEALRKMQYVNGSLCRNEREIVLENFLDDLYDILNKFCERPSGDKFVFRIYQVLSAGDFAVAIKSQYPETSFEISSRIRRRVAGIEGENGEISASQCALYKTYTLLTMERQLTKIEELLDTERNEGSFVIRGCYSCRYWACQREIQEYMENELLDIPESMSGLNGRYDFSVELSEESFYRVYEEIANYKTGSTKAKNDGWEEYQTQEEKYLVFLLQSDYMSYVNERYLLPNAKNKKQQPTSENVVSEFVLLDQERERLKSLMDENQEYIHRLIQKYQKLSASSQEILTTHQNAGQYFRLLEKHIMSCYTLNQQPDTRAFVAGIGEQLDTVLESMEVYCRLYADAKALAKTQIADLVVDYMREAVHAIDNYMEHIRNNNLQSLQTPNYNIESNMGMEKILIGYSEYLWKFIQYYQKKSETISNEKRKFCPIVVPDLHKMDICVEALFPEGYGDTWKEEDKIRKSNEQYNQYLLIIDSPTLSELGDLPVFMAMLFHEIAHQFRYETREKRNRVLADIIVKESMAELITGVMTEAFGDIGDNEEECEMRDMLIQVSAGTVIEWMEKNDYLVDDMKSPLICFKRVFASRFYNFIRAWRGETDFQSRGAQYIKEIQDVTDVCNCLCLKYLELFYDTITEKSYGTSGIEKAAFALAWRCAYEELQLAGENVATDELWLLETEKVREWCGKGDADKFGELWRPIRLASKDGQWETTEEIWSSFMAFALWIEENLYKSRGIDTKLYQVVNDFAVMLYAEVCDEWSKRNQKYDCIGDASYPGNQSQKLVNSYRSWTLMGRHLGIDKTGNEGRFWKIICAHLDDVKTDSMENEVSKYREITSDIFMYSIMGLSPFEYLKLVTMIISVGDLTRWFDIDRVVTVIYVMEVPDVLNAEAAMDKYWEICLEMLEKLENYYRTMVTGGDNALVIDEFDQIKKSWTGQIRMLGYVDIGGLVEKICQMKEKNSNNTDSQQILKHIEKMARTLRRILLDGPYYIKYLTSAPERLADYRTGVRELKKVRNDMKQDNNPFIKELSELCSLSTRYIQEKHYKTGVVKDAVLNEKSIEFLLGLYYSRKIRNTRKLRTQEEKRYED